jgi:hypothetical protein
MARNRRNSAIRPLKPDQRKRPAKCDKAFAARFSGRQKHSPVSRRTKGRRQGDHESIDWYEIMEVLPTIASDKKSERYQLLEELALRDIEDSAKKKSPDHGAINGREDT